MKLCKFFSDGAMLRRSDILLEKSVVAQFNRNIAIFSFQSRAPWIFLIDNATTIKILKANFVGW